MNKEDLTRTLVNFWLWRSEKIKLTIREDAEEYVKTKVNASHVNKAPTISKSQAIELVMNAYQRGYEDRDFDIGYGSNHQFCIEEIDKLLPLPPDSDSQEKVNRNIDNELYQRFIDSGDFKKFLDRDDKEVKAPSDEEIILFKHWYETEDHKTGWDCHEWEKENGDVPELKNYELVEVLETDKHGHETKAVFRKMDARQNEN